MPGNGSDEEDGGLRLPELEEVSVREPDEGDGGGLRPSEPVPGGGDVSCDPPRAMFGAVAAGGGKSVDVRNGGGGPLLRVAGPS